MDLQYFLFVFRYFFIITFATISLFIVTLPLLIFNSKLNEKSGLKIEMSNVCLKIFYINLMYVKFEGIIVNMPSQHFTVPPLSVTTLAPPST